MMFKVAVAFGFEFPTTITASARAAALAIIIPKVANNIIENFLNILWTLSSFVSLSTPSLAVKKTLKEPESPQLNEDWTICCGEIQNPAAAIES